MIKKLKLIKKILEIKNDDSSTVQMAKCMSGLNWYLDAVKENEYCKVIASVSTDSSYIKPLYFNINILDEKRVVSSLRFSWLFDKTLEEQSENTIEDIFNFAEAITKKYPE